MWFDGLPVLGDRPGGPQPKGKARLEVVEDARALDARLLEAWRKEVRDRDGKNGLVCKCCGRKVVVTLRLQANQAHCHHLVTRQHKPTRYDVRNGVLLCAECHRKVERNELRIVCQHDFQIGDRCYLNASGPISFAKAA